MTEDIDLEISKLTWNKISANFENEGYRKGASSGHEESFEKGFSAGFQSGYFNGNEIGKLNGHLRFSKIFGATDSNNTNLNLLDKEQLENCVLCSELEKKTTESANNLKSISEITVVQKNLTMELINSIKRNN